MRIIAGDLKGRRLRTPAGNKIRPTSDKVKEAVFNIIADEFCDEPVVDLFAGTGNLGLEAISRGAKHCYFGDKSRESLALIKENIKYCKVEDQATVLAGDFEVVLKRIGTKVQIVFLDPPYKENLMIPCIEMISELDLLKEEGIIVSEHGTDEVLPENIGKYSKIKEKRYGKIAVSIYG